MPHPLPNDAEGRMEPAAVEGAVREDDPHLPRSRLLLLENSFGGRGGAPLPSSYFAEMRRVAERHGLRTHLDGARLFNAATALEVPPAELTCDVDSVTFCLSKGLSAPVGSVLCGPADFVAQARRIRKSLGGGMRQAGVIAAAGVVALESMIDRLPDDHRHARLLAEGLARIPGIDLNPATVRTNIVHFTLEPDCGRTADELVERLASEHGILLIPYHAGLLRAVTHYWIGEREVEALLRGIRLILES
jgi:threonine aldolase